MKNTVNINSVELVNADSLQYIATLPDNSIDLIVTDPPYFKVKPNGWDNQWKGDEDYLRWLDMCLAQFWRVLKPAGSLYLFSGHRLAADIEIMMRERFNVLNHIIWAKPSGRWNGCNKESLRSYFPATERILFAEHYQGPYKPKSDGYAEKGSELKQHVMTPLISYFRDAREALGITSKQIADATGKKNMVSHWFSGSQWQLPNELDYRNLQSLFTQVAIEKHQNGELATPHHQLVAMWHSLNRKYSELLEEYKSLRRHFSVSVSVPYTDVWTHKPVQFYPGSSSKILTDTLASDESFFIKDERVHILKANEVTSGNIPVVNARSGLLNTPQATKISAQDDGGKKAKMPTNEPDTDPAGKKDTDSSTLAKSSKGQIVFDTKLNPMLVIGGLCAVESVTNPALNGVYKIYQIETSGQNNGAAWYQKVVCQPAGNYSVVN